MKKAKIALCIIFCVVLVMSALVGCGKAEPEDTTQTATPPPASSTPTASPPPAPTQPPPPPEDVKYKEDIVVTLGDKVAVIDIFNPAFQSSQAALVTNMIYDNLVYCTMDTTYEPELATSWETDDYKTFTFKLRDDVKFHNGEPFTADDVAFTIDKARESVGTMINDKFSQIEKYEIVNDYEIILTLKQANVDFIYDISYPTYPIVNREAYENDPDKGAWVGTGPWIVTDFSSNDYIKFVRNDNYFKELPKAKTFTMKYVSEETARMIMFENDELDFTGVSSDKVDIYRNDDRFILNSYVMNNTNFVAFNMNDPLLSDINFRLACAHAFNNQECVDITLNGYGVAAPTYWGYRTQYKNTDLQPYTYDLELAKEYLAKTSYNGEPIEVICAMPHTIKNAQVFQSQMALIGINIEIFETDGATLSANTMWGNTDAQIVVNSGAWSGLANSIRNYVYPNNNANKANYSNPEVSALLDQASVETDEAKREQLYKQVQAIVHEELPYLPIFNMELFIGGQAGTGGILFFANNNHDYSLAYRIID